MSANDEIFLNERSPDCWIPDYDEECQPFIELACPACGSPFAVAVGRSDVYGRLWFCCPSHKRKFRKEDSPYYDVLVAVLEPILECICLLDYCPSEDGHEELNREAIGSIRPMRKLLNILGERTERSHIGKDNKAILAKNIRTLLLVLEQFSIGKSEAELSRKVEWPTQVYSNLRAKGFDSILFHL